MSEPELGGVAGNCSWAAKTKISHLFLKVIESPLELGLNGNSIFNAIEKSLEIFERKHSEFEF